MEYRPEFGKFRRVMRLFSVKLGKGSSFSVQHRWQLLQDVGDGTAYVQNAVALVLMTLVQAVGQYKKTPHFEEKLFMTPQQWLEFVEYCRRRDVYEYARWLAMESQVNRFRVTTQEYNEDEEVLVPPNFDA